MNLLKTNKAVQYATVLAIIILSLFRIAHFIEQTTFLWIAFGFTLAALMVSQRVVERLQKRISQLEERRDD